MSETLFPYAVFRIDKPNASDPELGAYQLPNGNVSVLTNNLGQSEILFETKDKADAFLSEIKGRIKGEIVELDPRDYGKILTSSVSFEEKTIDVSTSQNRAEKSKPSTEKSKSDEKTGQDETKQQDRAETKKPDNNLPENLKGNAIDDTPAQNNQERAGQSKPESAGDGKSLGDQAQEKVTGFFGNGQRAASTLKGQLEDYVSDGGDPLLGALGATGLDALSLAMGFADSTISGYLDLRNLGEGIKKGTREGVVEDLGRLVNVLPAGKAAKAISAVLTAEDLIKTSEDIIQAVTQGNGKAVGAVVASAAAAMLLKKLTSGKGKSIKMEARFPEGKQTIMVPKKVLREAAKKSQKLNTNLIGREKKYNTLAVFVAYDPKTKKTFIPVSANKSTVQKKYRDLSDDGTEHLPGIDSIKGTNLHHAEVNGVTTLWSNGYGVVLVLPSNNACKDHCLPMLENWEIPVINPKGIEALLRASKTKG